VSFRKLRFYFCTYKWSAVLQTKDENKTANSFPKMFIFKYIPFTIEVHEYLKNSQLDLMSDKLCSPNKNQSTAE
jgi:hypothetical protein